MAVAFQNPTTGQKLDLSFITKLKHLIEFLRSLIFTNLTKISIRPPPRKNY
jgi:hypothetical protein